MPMKSMELSEKEMGDSDLTRNRYGYGLNLYLSEEHLKKLGFSEPLEPGTAVKIEAMGIVESANQSVRLDEDGKSMNMGIQVTELSVEEEGEVQDAANILYKKRKES